MKPAALLAALAVCVLPLGAHAMDLARFNAHFNATHPIRWGFDGLTWAQEGVDGYDCKGIVVLKYRALLELGEPSADMQVLLVDSSRAGWRHAVLLVDGQVLDEGPYLTAPADYRVIQLLPAAFFSLAAQLQGMKP